MSLRAFALAALLASVVVAAACSVAFPVDSYVAGSGGAGTGGAGGAGGAGGSGG